MINILIVEDEAPISQLIELNLTDAGYACTCAYDGLSAIDMVTKKPYDLVLLDIMLPGANGYEVFEYIKPLNIPVIFLTAKNALNDKVSGLSMGAEDYIVKPFEIVELLARVNVVLRRYNKTSTHLSFKDLDIDLQNVTVTKSNAPLELTPKEFSLLVLFVRNVNITLFRDRIYETVWGGDYMGDSRTIDLHIQRLRKKSGLNDCLKTIYGIGYRLES
jgi:DNA-binding response OmpR family regulator